MGMGKLGDDKGLIPIIIIIAGLVALGGVAAVLSYVMNNQSTLAPAIEEARTERSELSQENGYPSLWTEAGLPTYLNGTLLKTRQSRDLNEGVQVTLETSDSMPMVILFWESEMTSRGFTEAPGLPGNEYATTVRYTNGTKLLNLQITKIGDGPDNKLQLQYRE